MPYENRTHCEDCYYSQDCKIVNFYACNDFVPCHGTNFLVDREASLEMLPPAFKEQFLPA